MLKTGDKAPEFTLSDQNGRQVSLSDFKGKRVVLYFYPKDSTPGCTRQACAYGMGMREFAERNAAVIGISKDSVASHGKFAEKYSLPFPILSDPDHAVIEAYGCWQEKKMAGKVSMGTVRSTFLIDENGILIHAAEKVKPDTDPERVLALLDGMEGK